MIRKEKISRSFNQWMWNHQTRLPIWLWNFWARHSRSNTAAGDEWLEEFRKTWSELQTEAQPEPENKSIHDDCCKMTPEPEQLLAVDIAKKAFEKIQALPVGEIEFVEIYGSDRSYYTDINELIADALNFNDMGKTINITLYRTPMEFLPGSWLGKLNPIKCNYQVIDNPFYEKEAKHEL